MRLVKNSKVKEELEAMAVERLKRQISALNSELDELTRGIKPYPDRVVLAVEVHFQLVDIIQRTNVRRYVKARAVVIQILRDDGYSLPEIGDAVGRDHTTVMHSLRKFKPADFDIRAVRRLI